MSILIKGMEMPTCCYKCPLRRRNGMDIVCPVAHERFSVADINILEYRLDNCPLVPVPPHGDLVDKQRMAETNEQHYKIFEGEPEADYARKVVLRMLDQAPTIIPAEEVYGQYTDTAGNFHWCGTHSGEHTIKVEEGE